MEKASLLDPATHQKCVSRIEKLTPDSKPQWGKMSAAQMLSHCAEIQEVMNGKELKDTPFIAKLFKGLIRKMVLSENPYPKGTKTHPQYEQKEPCDFETGKNRLLKALDQFDKIETSKLSEIHHPLFGNMSPEEKGWAMYKHLDHHLSQFNV